MVLSDINVYFVTCINNFLLGFWLGNFSKINIHKQNVSHSTNETENDILTRGVQLLVLKRSNQSYFPLIEKLPNYLPLVIYRKKV